MYDPIEVRLANYHIKTPGGCWRWMKRRDRDGYGRITWHDTGWLAHRAMIVVTTGADIRGFDVDHLCRNRACVNPMHLDVVTKSVNSKRSWASGLRPGPPLRTLALVCGAGHEFDEENTYIAPNGKRYCRACNRAAAARYAKRKARAA